MANRNFNPNQFVNEIYENLYPNIFRLPFVTMPEIGMTLDEIKIMPGYSDILPHEVDLSTTIGNMQLNFPLITAPMSTVTDGLLAIHAGQCGAVGTIFREPSPQIQLDWIEQALNAENCLVGTPKLVRLGDKVATAERILSRHSRSVIPVLTNKGLLSGLVFTDNIAFNEKHAQEPIKKWMVKFQDLKVAYVGTPFAEIKERLIKEPYCNVLPLVDKNRKFYGLYFMKDVLAENQTTFNDRPLVGMSIGASPEDINQRLIPALEMGVGSVVVDTSHGNCKEVLSQTASVLETVAHFAKKRDITKPTVISGNVADVDGYVKMCMLEVGGAKVDAVKFGIGCGSICTTSNLTGIGVPLFTNLREAAYTKLQLKKSGKYAAAIIADGGIPGTGQAVVALGAGADGVMAGKWVVAFSESISGQKRREGEDYVDYEGMASPEALKKRLDDRYIQKGHRKTVPEGIAGKVLHRGPTRKCMRKDKEAMQIAISHTGAKTISALQTYCNANPRRFYTFSGVGTATQLSTHVN
ncbi:MAG: IMP dehydrogenase [Patescibacteria group bacterium]|nr:IMP dehydrogenase [Patescibacteria group bacterium]